jgi:hypothetical protein
MNLALWLWTRRFMGRASAMIVDPEPVKRGWTEVGLGVLPDGGFSQDARFPARHCGDVQAWDWAG